MKKRLEHKEGKPWKFWEIELHRNEVKITSGILDSEGKTERKTFSADTAALRFVEKKIAEKIRSGFLEIPASEYNMAGLNWEALIQNLKYELGNNQYIQLSEWVAEPPLSKAGKEKLSADSLFKNIDLGFYEICNGLKFEWKLIKKPSDLNVDLGSVHGGANILALDEVMDNGWYISGYAGNNKSLWRHYPFALYGNEIDAALFAGKSNIISQTIRLMSNSGIESGISQFTFPRYLYTMIKCRGFVSFASIIEGTSSGNKTMCAVLENVFGDNHIPDHYFPKLKEEEKRIVALTGELEQCLSKFKVDGEIIKGRLTDPYLVYFVIPDDFSDFKLLNQFLSEFAGSGVTVTPGNINMGFGEVAIVTRKDYEYNR